MINNEIYIKRTSEENLFKKQLNDLNSCAQGNEPFGKIFLIYASLSDFEDLGPTIIP